MFRIETSFEGHPTCQSQLYPTVRDYEFGYWFFYGKEGKELDKLAHGKMYPDGELKQKLAVWGQLVTLTRSKKPGWALDA